MDIVLELKVEDGPTWTLAPELRDVFAGYL
jgi:hypothetical protein